jgi:hypothetical protein
MCVERGLRTPGTWELMSMLLLAQYSALVFVRRCAAEEKGKEEEEGGGEEKGSLQIKEEAEVAAVGVRIYVCVRTQLHPVVLANTHTLLRAHTRTRTRAHTRK